MCFLTEPKVNYTLPPNIKHLFLTSEEAFFRIPVKSGLSKSEKTYRLYKKYTKITKKQIPFKLDALILNNTV